MKLLKDLAKAMNFTYQNRYPSDGGLWGDISEDGIATGLVGDIMVIKIESYYPLAIFFIFSYFYLSTESVT